MTDTELNEFCARELGWTQKPIRGRRIIRDEEGCECCTPSREEIYVKDIWHAPGCSCAPYTASGNCMCTPPDFLASESANALLLEKMFHGVKDYHKVFVMIWQQYYKGYPIQMNAYRRAIVLAFVEWRKSCRIS